MTDEQTATSGHGAADAQSALASLHHVVKRFRGTTALDGMSLEIPRGQIIGLLGYNGSGKSTLLKLIAGLYRPTSGEVLVYGQIPGRATKSQVAYMPEVDHLYPRMRVSESLGFVSAFFDDWDAAKADELLDFMALPRDARIGGLSKGMRTRLRLVVTLARRAPLILLDEPLSGIDPPSRRRIVEALLSAYDADEQSVVISTHEVLEVESVFDRLLFVGQGKLRLDAAADEVRAQHGKSIQDLFEEVLQ